MKLHLAVLLCLVGISSCNSGMPVFAGQGGQTGWAHPTNDAEARGCDGPAPYTGRVDCRQTQYPALTAAMAFDAECRTTNHASPACQAYRRAYERCMTSYGASSACEGAKP